MAWIDDALPMPPARPVEADEALDAAASALIAFSASVAAMQLFVAVVLQRPAEMVVYGIALVATGAAGFVPVESSLRRRMLAMSASASVLLWLAMLPLAREGEITVVVLCLAAAAAALSRKLLDTTRPAELDFGAERPADPGGWIEDDVTISLSAATTVAARGEPRGPM